ncbi:MAG TPA: PKD domain-containing protein, partial [Bacteroidales bacterium]|nr:PKD domain-containing protein [Bacteroidales bacterium]
MTLKTTLMTAACILFSAMYTAVDAQTDILQAGNLESETGWSTSLLNTPAGSEPVAIWNYTTDAPTAGQGGNLHVTGLSNNTTVQYAIYQPVHLSSDSLYSFDGAFKALAMNNAWCEAYLGAAPVDGNDYGSESVKISDFGTWNLPVQNDGTFSLDATNSPFIPDTTGTYYLVVKMGSTSWTGEDMSFDIIIDELTFTRERVAPVVSFKSDVVMGYAPLTVTFTNSTDFATSYVWDFGDGSSTVADANPVHEYSTAGLYSVTLTATNEIGETVYTENDMIEVNPPEQLTGGGILVGGNLEDESQWSTSFLNSPAGNEPTVNWNYTVETPSAGQGGCLYVSGNSNNSTVQYAIYQQVHLSADSVYNFNGAFRDLTPSLNQFWCEAYIGAEPVDGLD